MITTTFQTTSAEAPVQTTTPAATTPFQTAPTTTSASSTSIITDADGQEIDDAWALFLVNQKSPLPAEYSIETKTVYESYMKFKMDSRIADHMTLMIADAKKDNISLIICSAYRSYQTEISF